MFRRLNKLQHSYSAVLFLALPLFAFGEEKESPAPRSLYLTGHYAEAADLYKQTADKDAAAALGLARCQMATGEYEIGRAHV